MDEREPCGTARWINAQRLEQSHRIEIAIADHVATLRQALGERERLDRLRHERDGGCALSGTRGPEQSDIAPTLEEVKQPRQQRQLCDPQCLTHASGAPVWIGAAVMVRIELVKVLGDAARGGDLCMVGARRAQALEGIIGIEVMAFIAQPARPVAG